ncbi:hypothetical protein BH23VER1_BH23VER1_20110 [soil metagenome]
MSETPEIPGYELHDPVGSGAAGTVYRAALESTGQLCAVKVYQGMAINRQYLSFCLGKLFSLPPDPHVIELIGGDLNNRPYYVATGFHRRSLADVLDPEGADGAETWRIIKEIAAGVAFLHRHGLIHCNLTVENIRMTDGDEPAVRVTDFGTGWIGGIHHLEFGDHPYYLSPDQLRHPDQIANGQGERWDVYSFGVIAFRLLTGRFPRGEPHISEYIRMAVGATQAGACPTATDFASLIENDEEIEWGGEVTTGKGARWREVIKRCLSLSPDSRYADLREVLSALEAIEREREFEGYRREVEVRETRMRRRSDRWRAAAVVFGVLAVGAGTAIGILRHQMRISESEAEFAAGKVEEELAAKDNVIGELERTAVEAMANRALAEQNWIQAQRTADHFFGLVVGSEPEGEVARQELDRGLASAASFYESFLEEAEAHPDLEGERIRAEHNLARIYLKQGREGEALQRFAGVAGRLESWLESGAANQFAAEFLGRLASAKLEAARLQTAEGNPDAALTLLDEVRQRFDAAAEAGGLGEDVERLLARAHRLRADILVGREHYSSALEANNEALHLIAPLASRPEAMPEDILLEAHAVASLGEIHREQGDLDESVSKLVDAVETLLDLSGADPENPRALFALANAYAELGRSMATIGNATDASLAHTEAIKIMADLVKTHPDEDEFRYLLAVEYDRVADLVRDFGDRKKAGDYQKGAVSFLEDLFEKSPSNLLYATALSKAQGSLAELQADAGDRKMAIDLLKTAIERLKPPAGSGKLPPRSSRAARVSLAHLYGLLAHQAELGGDEAVAEENFTHAVAAWEALADDGAESDVVAKGLAWSRERLAKYSP